MNNMKNKLKLFIKIFIILICLFIIFYILLGIYKENKITLKEDNHTQVKIDKTSAPQKNNKIENVHIEEQYLGYEVAAKLIIKKIGLETYILKEYSKETMDLCPTKFWGVDSNEIGNFCIVGHNYKKENMFNNLINLSVGDEFQLLDNKNGKFTYTIDDIYKVKPQNTDCLNQNTNGKRVVTLITCVNYSNTRLIIKATEKGNT